MPLLFQPVVVGADPSDVGFAVFFVAFLAVLLVVAFGHMSKI